MSEQETKQLGGLARTKRSSIEENFNNTDKVNKPKKYHAREMAKISRTSVAYALEGQPVKIKMALDLLFDEDPRAYIDAISKLLNYAVPKLSSTEIKHDTDRKIEIKLQDGATLEDIKRQLEEIERETAADIDFEEINE